MWCAWIVLLAIVSLGKGQEYKLSVMDLPTSPSDSRIIGGAATTIERFPYTVQVLYNSQLSCAGSLLTQRHVLSAGHCFVDGYGYVVSPTYFSVRVGTNTLNSGGTVHRVSTIVVHESYNNPLRDNDVAVMLLTTAVTLSAQVATANIPISGSYVPDNSVVTAVGWGRTNAAIPAASTILNEVDIYLVNWYTCFSRYQNLQQLLEELYPVTYSMICAGVLDIGGKDACQGDSGGPLIYNGVVVGITSWGYGCAHPTYPGVYARVSSYTTWINNTVTRYNAGSLNSSVGATSLLIPLLYLILSV